MLRQIAAPACSERTNSNSPLLCCHGLVGVGPVSSQQAISCVSRSVSACTFVVSVPAWPSHARIVLMSAPERSRCVAVVRCLSRAQNKCRSAATHLPQAGVDLVRIGRWPGYAGIATTSRYATVDVETKPAAVRQARPVAGVDPALAAWRSDVNIRAWLESL